MTSSTKRKTTNRRANIVKTASRTSVRRELAEAKTDLRDVERVHFRIDLAITRQAYPMHKAISRCEASFVWFVLVVIAIVVVVIVIVIVIALSVSPILSRVVASRPIRHRPADAANSIFIRYIHSPIHLYFIHFFVLFLSFFYSRLSLAAIKSRSRMSIKRIRI